MKAKTARPFLLVMLFGFLASNGWMITEYGPGTSGSALAPPSAAVATPANTAHGATPPQTSAIALQPLVGAAHARPGTMRTGNSAASPQDGLSDVSAPVLASVTPVNPETALPSDPVSNLAFPGATNLGSGSGGSTGGLPADPPVIGARPGNESTSPPVSGGGPSTKELAEPGSLGLLAAGVIVLGLMRWRARAA